MDDYEIIKWLLVGAVIGSVITSIIWSSLVTDRISRQADFLLLLNQGFSVKAAWRLSR